MKNTTKIVYGPPGCGKSVNAEMLKKHFGCQFVIDNWHATPSELTPNALHLWQLTPETSKDIMEVVKLGIVCMPSRKPLCMSFEDAMRDMAGKR